MTGRIDYRYNAAERIKVAVTNPDETQAQTTALIAQAEATLALVEQLRIANLIALGQATHADGSRIYWRAIVDPAGHDSAIVRADIREGLGL